VKPDWATCLGCSTARLEGSTVGEKTHIVNYWEPGGPRNFYGSTSAIYDVGHSFDDYDDDDNFSVVTSPSTLSTLERPYSACGTWGGLGGSGPRRQRRKQQLRRRLQQQHQQQRLLLRNVDGNNNASSLRHFSGVTDHVTMSSAKIESALTPLISPLCQHLKDNHPEVFEHLFGFQLGSSSTSLPR
jgi:hypothetical protein